MEKAWLLSWIHIFVASMFRKWTFFQMMADKGKCISINDIASYHFKEFCNLYTFLLNSNILHNNIFSFHFFIFLVCIFTFYIILLKGLKRKIKINANNYKRKKEKVGKMISFYLLVTFLPSGHVILQVPEHPSTLSCIPKFPVVSGGFLVEENNYCV